MTSVYVQCAEAANMLLDDPSIRPINIDAPPGVFTELDVIMLAARKGTAQMTTEQRVAWMDNAQREASQAMGVLWRTSRVVRYAPVRVPGVDRPDYMRIASKIVYAPQSGPRKITTPNGTFPRIYVMSDPAKGPGRRHGANRDDLRPWAEQDLSGDARTSSEPRDIAAELRAEVKTLRARLAEALAERDEAVKENERLRDSAVTRGELLGILNNDQD